MKFELQTKESKMPLITEIDTYTATIYVGTASSYNQRKKFTNNPKLIAHPMAGKNLCEEYCDSVGLCVTFTETTFIYSGDSEPGLIIGLINYPRFPKSKNEIRRIAFDLARELQVLFCQKRVSVVFPDKTIMIGDLDNG